MVPLSSGRKRKRNDSFGVSAKAQLVKLHDKLRKTQPWLNPDALVLHLAREVNRPPRLLRKVIEAGGKWMKLLRSKGHTPTGLRRDEAQQPQYLRSRTKRFGTLVRAPGAGRKSDVDFLYPVVEVWFNSMRDGGHHVAKADLVTEFRRMAKVYLDRVEVKREDIGKLSNLEVQRAEKLRKRLKSLEKDHAKKFLANMIQRHLDARLLKPQRVLTLTMDEEKMRACDTWRLFDWMMDQMVRRSGKFFEDRFALPQQAMSRLHETVLMFSDQIPCWLKIAPGRQLFRKDEVPVKKKRKVDPKELLQQMTGQILISQVVVDEAAPEGEAAPEDENASTAVGQKRGQGVSEQSRYRVTIEACQVVLN